MKKYVENDLRDIYYLFSYNHRDYDEIIKERFPELVKYDVILRSILFNIVLFRGNEPYFHSTRHQNIGFGYPKYIMDQSYSDGIYFMTYLLDMMFHIPDNDIPLITNSFIDVLSFSYKDNILYKLKTFLLPEVMVKESIYLYAENFNMHLVNEDRHGSKESKEYRDLYVYDAKLIDFRQKVQHRYCVESVPFFHMILAYFYANASKFNRDYRLIDNMLLNFYDKEEYYLHNYQNSYPDRRVARENQFYDYSEVYRFIEDNAISLMQDITDSNRILTEDKMKDIENVIEKVFKGELSNFEACNYLQEKYGFSKCLIFPSGNAFMEYPNGCNIKYDYYYGNGFEYSDVERHL